MLDKWCIFFIVFVSGCIDGVYMCLRVCLQALVVSSASIWSTCGHHFLLLSLFWGFVFLGGGAWVQHRDMAESIDWYTSPIDHRYSLLSVCPANVVLLFGSCWEHNLLMKIVI